MSNDKTEQEKELPQTEDVRAIIETLQTVLESVRKHHAGNHYSTNFILCLRDPCYPVIQAAHRHLDDPNKPDWIPKS